MTSLLNVSPGKNVPQEINVIVEIPAHADPVKYEIDKDSGLICVDRFVGTSMVYPCNYGFVPRTKSDDGDPVDVLVIAPFSLLSGSIIACRPVAVLVMEDEAGLDHKILAVPVSKLTKLYDHINGPNDVPEIQLNQIRHFFEHYKDLEVGKWVKVHDWEGKEKAYSLIESALDNYKE